MVLTTPLFLPLKGMSGVASVTAGILSPSSPPNKHTHKLCISVIGRARRVHILIDANPDEPTDSLPQHPRPTRCTVGYH